MYNYSINTTYLTLDDDKQDTQYRKEYLSVFNLEKYDEDVIMNTVDTLYKTYKDNEQIKNLFSIGSIKLGEPSLLINLYLFSKLMSCNSSFFIIFPE